MRIVLIGPGDIKFHYTELLNIPEGKFNGHIDDIAKALVESSSELVLLPDRGICFEVAKRYKQYGGSKVYGTVPLSDKDFGIKHLQPFMDAEIDGEKVFDEFIDTKDWYRQDLTHCIFGDVILMLGNSLGAQGELDYAYYLYKLFIGDKPEVNVAKKKIHPEVRAGDSVQFTTIVYKPFIKEKLNAEIEAYIRKHKGDVFYVKSAEALKSKLDELVSIAKQR